MSTSVSNGEKMGTGGIFPRRLFRSSCPMLLLLCLGCSLGPKYRQPAVPLAPVYKEMDPSIWKPAQPGDRAIREKWWELFQDPQLNALEEKIEAANQNIALAAANYSASRAIVRQTHAQYFPTVAASLSITNSRLAVSPFAPGSTGFNYTEYSFPLTASWEPDLWGRVRYSVRASSFAAQSNAADLENVRLLAHASLAVEYFQLRGVEQQKKILEATVSAWQQYLDLTRGLYQSGLATDEALAAAESQLKATQAQDTNLGIARAQYEHAIAVLLGESPSVFAVAASTEQPAVPTIPPGMPAELLERRPDVAAAERTVAQANSQIGIARAAYFPNVVLSASGGIESLSFTNWFTWPSRFWSVGPSATEVIFDGGARKAGVQQAASFHESTVASYRQTVLIAFQQVEDNLAALRVLSEDLEEQRGAIESAKRYLDQATTRNVAGLDPFLNVLNARTSLLAYQLAYVNFQTQQRISTVQLIEALGGGWNRSQLPTPAQVAKEKGHTP